MTYDYPWTKNVRFWIFINEGLVKITLKPDQELRWYRGYITEEGWGSEELTFQYDSDMGKVVRHNNSAGKDCDGRVSHCSEKHCSFDDLSNGCENYEMISDAQGNVICFPDWGEVSSSQYDQNAQLAGY